MVQPKIICIFIFVVLINCIYSQQNDNRIIWQWSYNEGNNVGFSVNLPENWVAIENNNPQKPICYNFYMENNIYKVPVIFIAMHVLDDTTDEALRERINIVIGNKGYRITQIERNYSIIENSFTYDVDVQSLYFSRDVFVRYKQYCFQINLGTMHEKANDELIIVLDELVNSLVFFENN
jgi:hypothetical protein